MRIGELAFMILISTSILLGMFNFMYDLGYYSNGERKYNISVPVNMNATASAIAGNINSTATTITSLVSSKNSFTQTAFTIFFTLPFQIVQALMTIGTSGSNLVGIALGSESKLPIPPWVILISAAMIGIVIAFSIKNSIMGGD